MDLAIMIQALADGISGDPDGIPCTLAVNGHSIFKTGERRGRIY